MRRSAWALPFVLGLATLGSSRPARADDHADVPSGATSLTVGVRAAGAIDAGGDRDWFSFRADAGASYTVQTLGLGSGMDSIIGVWDAADAFVGQNDDFAGTLASRIDFKASSGGTCHVLVVHYDRTAGRGTYALQVTQTGVAPGATTIVTSPPAPTPAPTPTASGAGRLAAAPAFDPKLEGASLDVRSRLDGSGAYAATLSVVDRAGRVVRTLVQGAQRQAGTDYADAWDGRDPAGRFVAPGAYTLRLEAARAGQPTVALERALPVVRLGLVSITFADTGTGGTRVPLEYHRTNPSVAGTRFALDAAGPAWTAERSSLGDDCLDQPDGTPTLLPAVWTRLDTPPRTSSGSVATRGRSLPVAYAPGARPTLRLRLGESAASGGAPVSAGYPVAGAPLRVVLEGEASSDLAPAAEVALRAPALPDGVGRYDLEYAFRFQAWDGQAWADVPGRVRTSHRVYVVLGPPAASNLRRPWVAVVDRVAQWSAGRARDVAGVLDAVTHGVNEAEGLSYDVWTGAPAYADGWQLWEPELDLDGWLSRTRGSVVNCLDCASLVTALAAQVGAPAEVAIVGDNFRLNWLRGIGGTRFIHDLFGGYHAFSYHAMATIDAAATVHDACLRVDDDTRPDAAPHTERLPVAMPFARYRDKLGADPFHVTGRGRSTVR